ncbi:MAG: SRPBCC domain-containing protein [Rhodospirillales bacterium]
MSEQELVIERLIDAPVERVFQAWTEAKQVKEWWGPRGFTAPVCEVDARPGGRLRIVMRGPDGTDYPMSGTYRDVEPDQRLVFVSVAEDNAGDALLEAFTEVTFAAQGNKTRLVMKTSAVGLALVAAEMLKGMEQGWSETLDRMAAHAKGT